MKISNASKKVLASALSLAMVAAFSPATAAFATPNHDTNDSASYEVSHTMDHGTVTKAATCDENGYVTYKCIKDGCDYSYVQVIPATGKHSYSVDTTNKGDKDGVADGVNWYYDAGNNNELKATVFFKCANSGEVEEVDLDQSSKWSKNGGEISSKVTKEATFNETGVKTYTLEAELDGVKVKSTFAEPISLQTFGFASVAATDNYGTVKLNIIGQDEKTAAVVNGDIKTKVTPGNCQSEEVTGYTVTFAATPGVSSTEIAYCITDSTSHSELVVNGQKIANSSVTPKVDGSVVVKFSVTGKKDASKHQMSVTGVDAIGYQGYALNSANVDKAALENGTASTDASLWTITATQTCTHEGQTATNYANVKPSSVTKEQVGDVWVYTLTYGNGYTYSFYAGSHKAAYALETVWNIVADANEYASAQGSEVVAVDATAEAIVGLKNLKNEAYSNSNAKITVTTALSSKGKGVTKPTCEAAGSYEWIFEVTKATANAEINRALNTTSVEYITADYSDTASGTIAQLPKNADHYYYVGDSEINWNSDYSSAFASVKCSGGTVAARLTSTDISSKVVAGATSNNRDFSTPVLKYTAKFTTDLVVDQTHSTGFVRNADGSYSVTAEKSLGAAARYAGALDSTTNLPSAADATNAANWTVTIDGKNYTPTKVEADPDFTGATDYDETGHGDTCGVLQGYKVTLADGSTYSYQFASKSMEHSYELTGYSVDSERGYAIFTCTNGCGKVKVIKGSSFDRDGMSVVTFPDGSKVNVYKNTTDVAQDNWSAPTFKFYTSIENGVIHVGATATFTSQDGSKVVYADCDVTLVDAKTNTYKATVVSSEVPAGYTGADSTLTTTKVVKLHEGHAVNKIKTVKATATAAGYIKYFCNNDNMTYRVVIAKDNMKLAKKAKTFKYAKVKKAAKKVTIKVKNAKGKVSYKVASKVKKAGVSVTAKGVVKVKKGTAKGTYKVTVTSKATSQYKANTKTFKVKVK